MKPGVRALTLPVVSYGLAWLVLAIGMAIGAFDEPVIDAGEIVFFGGWLFFAALWWAWVWALRDMASVGTARVGPRLVLRAILAVPTIFVLGGAGFFFAVASTWSLTGRTSADGPWVAAAIGLATLVGVASEIAIVVASVQVFRTKVPAPP